MGFLPHLELENMKQPLMITPTPPMTPLYQVKWKLGEFTPKVTFSE